jgi:DNA repair photolyase
MIIYEPKGKAREYSPYALNIYKGCDHNCDYCYVKLMEYQNQSTDPIPRSNLVENLKRELKRNTISKQVLLCFTGDPYCKAEMTYNKTREVLELLNQHNVPVAILSKGGNRILKDLDLFKKFKNIKIGATLTLTDNDQSKKHEPGASLPEERMNVLKTLYKEGIRTWVSFEPVIDVNQTFQLFEKTKNYIDEYQIGKMNHYNTNINWQKFGDYISLRMEENRKDYYIKKDLYKFMTRKLEQKYIEQDYLTLETKIPKIQTKLQPALF